MNTTYLKFTDEAEAIAILAQYRIVDEAGVEQWQTASHAHALDVVGTIYKPTGNVIQISDDPLVQILYEMAPIPGFHINFIGELPPEAATFVVVPINPVRVFA